MPEYEVRINDKDQLAPVHDIERNECPVSILRRHSWGPEIRNMVTEISRSIRIRDLTGAWPGGIDAGRWSVRWSDAVDLAEMEKRRTDRAFDEACDGVKRMLGDRK